MLQKRTHILWLLPLWLISQVLASVHIHGEGHVCGSTAGLSAHVSGHGSSQSQSDQAHYLAASSEDVSQPELCCLIGGAELLESSLEAPVRLHRIFQIAQGPRAPPSAAWVTSVLSQAPKTSPPSLS